jgi:hypothetical protein
VRVFEAVEAYRASVLAKDARPDDCKWQTDFLIYATTVRDRLAAGGPAPDVAALRYFERVAAAIGEVERMRTSKDPAIAGPRPAGSNERRIWMMERNEKIRPLERSLDELGELLRGGHAPSLKSAAWLPRLNACLMACERYFDEKVRADEPPSGELAAAEWPRILAAAAVLRSFSGYIPAP